MAYYLRSEGSKARSKRDRVRKYTTIVKGSKTHSIRGRVRKHTT
jgi:hypothetical protein